MRIEVQPMYRARRVLASLEFGKDVVKCSLSQLDSGELKKFLCRLEGNLLFYALICLRIKKSLDK
jgi:hypothetical protein